MTDNELQFNILYAESYAEKRAAKRVQGVKKVANDLKVSLPCGSKRTDADISRAAAQALAWNIWMPHHEQFKITVSNGWVILRGSVRSWEGWEETDWVVWSASGVCDVDNELVVNP